MKPKEFDELIRSKFDEGEFAYSPAQWGKLEERMDGKPGKRRGVIWLSLTAFATVGSVAASLAMVFSVAAFLYQKETPVAMVQKPHADMTNVPAKPVQAYAYDVPAATPVATEEKVAAVTNTKTIMPTVVVAAATPVPQATLQETVKKVTEQETTNKPYYTFNTYEVPEKADVNRKVVISVAGGFNYGSSISGYSIGATGKKMLGDRLYIEGDVAIVNSNASQKNEYSVPVPARNVSTRTTSATGGTGDVIPASSTGTVIQQTNNNAYYAQLTPTVGYRVYKSLSIGVGADMQKLLQDNKSADGTRTDGVKDIAPYDFGFVAKTECALSKKVKAGIYYRQGVSNALMPGNNYLDRNYVQVQFKYTILNK
jgi:hypothetical protein